LFQTGNNNFVFKMWKDGFVIQYFFINWRFYHE